MFFEAELRMRMQIAPQRGQRGMLVADELDGIHADAPAACSAARLVGRFAGRFESL
jgi:hypothetical protein